MSKKMIYLAILISLPGVIFTSITHAANVIPQVYVSFNGSLARNVYTLDPREIDTTGTFASHNGTEIVSDGLGILSDPTQSGQESFQFDASGFNNNGVEFTGLAFVVEAVFTRTGDCDFMAPVIDVGGQCFIRFHNGLSAGSWNGNTESVNNDIQPIPEPEQTLHYAIVYDGADIIDYYVDGVKIFQSNIGSPQEITKFISWGNIRHTSNDGERQIIGQYDSVAFSTFTGKFDPSSDFILPGGPVYPELASNPNPANEATDVLWDQELSWTPGSSANKHDVYIGTVLDNVDNSSRNNLTDVLADLNRDVNTYNPSLLDFDKNYYWRIDEVNSPPDNTIFKGNVWNFTVESLAYQISGENITAAASSQMEGQGPENTINNSGLDNGLHSNVLEEMWLSLDETPVWIQYEFDKLYKLHEMSVWNYNGPSILYMYGLKDVIVEYSIDSINWFQIPGISEFSPGTGKKDYACNNTFALNDITAKYIRITATDNWSGGALPQYGLSEVSFMYIPLSARGPNPESGTEDIAVDTYLRWKKGREAIEHKVYFSDNEQAVIDGTAAPIVTTSASYYGPLSLDLAKTYYWRVDEVNNTDTTTIWQGDTWNFTSREYLVVEDFESYNDIPNNQEGSNLVYMTWIDGYDNPSANGSTIGYISGSSLETIIVHGGYQSVPVMYDNTVASISEVTVKTTDLSIGGDWTNKSPENLVMWFYGDPNNPDSERMYIKVDNAKVIYNGDLTQENWQEFSIDLKSLGIDLTNVETLVLGFERIGQTGSTGMIFIDDFRLYAALE